MKVKTSTGAGCGCVTVIVILVASALIGGFCWTYSINTWLTFFGEPAEVVWWQGALVGFVPALGQLSIPIAVVTWIAIKFIN